MKQSTITLLILLAPILWLLFRPRLAVLRSRFALALRIGIPVYFGLIIFQLSQSEFTDDQLVVAAFSLAIFGGVWLAAWLVTSRMRRRGE